MTDWVHSWLYTLSWVGVRILTMATGWIQSLSTRLVGQPDAEDRPEREV
jgi:hypothetical protein